MALDITSLKKQIDEVVIDGKVLSDKEQKNFLSEAYYTIVTYYLLSRANNEALYFANLKAQLKEIVFNNGTITNPDRDTLLNEIYIKCISYYNTVVELNRAPRLIGGPFIGTPGVASTNVGKLSEGSKFSTAFSISFNGYFLNE